MTPDEIIGTFIGKWLCPTQAQLDALVGRLGVPIQALMYDNDGGGYPAGMLRIERGGNTFEFSDDPAIRPICGFVAWNRWNEAHDLVAWSPRDGWAGSWLGQAALLNEYELQTPRGDAPLPVHPDVLSWLRNRRDGVAIIDRKRAWRELFDVTMAATCVEAGLALRNLLEQPRPRIKVPAQQTDERAAA